MSHFFEKLSREQMKTYNQKLILRLLKEHDTLSKAQLSEFSQLTIPAVTGFINTLYENKLIEEVGTTKTSRGRFPSLFRLRTDAIHVLAVTIATSHVKAAILDLNGTIKKIYQTSLPPHSAPEQAMVYVRKLIEQCDHESYQILGLGIGVHGIVDTDEGVLVFPPQLQWRSYPIIEELNKYFPYPILVDNDCNAMVLAERWFGCAKEGQTSVSLNVDYGIGAGIYMNSMVFRGSHHAAGQIGHTTIEENGPTCPCGNDGCLEMFASEPSILRALTTEVTSGATSIAKDIAGDIDSIRVTHLYEAAILNDKLSNSLISKAGMLTGKGVSGLINILNPDRIILTGGILRSEDTFFEPFKKAILDHSIESNTKHLEVLKSDLGEHIDIMGAASLWIDQLFDTQVPLDSLNIKSTEINA